MPHSEIRDGEVARSIATPADAALVFIGRIRTPWATRRECPRRGSLDGPDCQLELDSRWEEALQGLEPGAMLQILYWMHEARRDLLIQRPTARPTGTGTFALRSPNRPNPIASSLAVMRARQGATLIVRGLDCLDGTPLLDIKPDHCPVWPAAS